MRLIVGLGNPDPEYQWTPHNLGFMAVDELANRASIRVERPEGKALVGRGKLAGEEILLAKPQTYMNLSGISVRELLAKYELDVSDFAGDVGRSAVAAGHHPHSQGWQRRQPQRREIRNQRPRHARILPGSAWAAVPSIS